MSIREPSRAGGAGPSIDRQTVQGGAAAPDPSEMAADDLRQLVLSLNARQDSLEQENAKLRRISREQSRAREEVHGLYDRSPVGDVCLDPNGVIVRANRTATVVAAARRCWWMPAPGPLP